MKKFKTIKNNCKSEIVEKKSKFIGFTFYVESVDEAEKYIAKMKKEYRDSRHQVFAYNIQNRDGGISSKFSDDGEPSGTAGAPILKIITEKKLCNILVVVVRYFGGILLGAGGLVRTYSYASIKVIEESVIIDRSLGYVVKLCLKYPELEGLRYYLGKSNIRIIDIEYLDNIELIVEIPEDLLSELTNNNSKNTFKILKYDILEEKLIQI